MAIEAAPIERVYSLLLYGYRPGDAVVNDKREPSDKTQANEGEMTHDPRPVSDAEMREANSREEVEGYRKNADKAHSNWFSVMNNPYGKD